MLSHSEKKEHKNTYSEKKEHKNIPFRWQNMGKKKIKVPKCTANYLVNLGHEDGER